jgi:hypothetical protein
VPQPTHSLATVKSVAAAEMAVGGRAVAGTDRVTRIAMNVLTCALAAVYLFSAATMLSAQPRAAGVEAAIGIVELIWIAAVALGRDRRRTFIAGAGLQLLLSVVWLVSRTAGLPGVGRLPIGEFDLLCAADAVAIAVLAWRCASPGLRWTPRVRMGLCQLAIVLAASTAYMSMAGMMTMTGPASAASGVAAHGPATEQFFCHLL